jgi:tetratricopeptide (TPR) repeat protein
VGSIVVDGSSGVLPNTSVVLECGGTERARTETDNDGSFILSPTTPAANDAASAPRGTVLWNSSGVADCTLYGDAQGYTSSQVYLSKQDSSGTVAKVGTIVLRPVNSAQANQDATVSVASLSAPPKAKKAFEKGQKQVRKNNWQSACDYFRQAVQIYPPFAAAWLELGRAQAHQQNLAEARHSFQRAIDEDSHLAGAYGELASLAAKQNDWSLLTDVTDHLVQQLPNSSPSIWFLNSIGKFNTGQISNAKHSAEQGLRLDLHHAIPQLEYLYGMILARERNYVSAAQHIRTYLRLAPHTVDTSKAQAALSDIEQRAPDTNQGSAP